jgi:hypothetical protein
MAPVRNISSLRGPAYVVAGLLMLFSVLDVVLTVLPLSPGNVNWRFGVAGLAAAGLVGVLLAVLLAYVVALLTGQRRTLRVLAGLSILAAALALAFLAVLLLDAIQLSGSVPAQRKSVFLRSTAWPR